MLLFLGVLSIVLGIIGFHKRFILTGVQANFGSYLYSSLQLLNLTGGNIPLPIPWELEVARWLSPTVALYTVLLGLTRLFRHQLQILLMRFTSGHIVICGLGQKGLLLAKNFRNIGKYVVVIEKDANNSKISICDEIGALVLIGEARDAYLLRKAGVARASHLIIVCGDDGTNAEIAVRARQIASLRKERTKLTCVVHLQDVHLWNLLRQQEFNAERTISFRMDFFNAYDSGARQLLNLYPIIPTERPIKTSPHILLVGLGNLGEQLMLNIARQWYPIYMESGIKFRISVIDSDANQKLEKIAKKYSLVSEVCEWIAYPLEVGSSEFEKTDFFSSQESICDISQVYVCTEDETIDLSAALSILKRTRNNNIEILVRMNDDSGLASLLRATQGTGIDFSRLHVYGLLERTCKPEFLNDGSHESLAREIHKEYVRNESRKGNTPETNPNMVDWDQLSNDIKEMNRDQADDIGYLLDAIRCDILPWIDFGMDEFKFSPEEIEILSKMEHERWCKLKFEQGWVYGPTKNEKKKEHPSLIAWDDMRFSESEKEKDRNTVRQAPHFLALAGFQIYRIASGGNP